MSCLPLTRRAVLVIGVTAVAVVALHAQSMPLVSSSPSGPQISGHVVDGATGAPVPHASVRVLSVRREAEEPFIPGGGVGPLLPFQLCSAVTDTSGAFSCQAYEGGSAEIEVVKSGSVGWWGQETSADAPQWMDIVPGRDRAGLRIPLWRRAVVTGRVLDEHDRPVVGVQVEALAPKAVASHWDYSDTGTTETVTDDRGMYTLGVSPGERLIVVLASLDSTRRTAVDGHAAVYRTTFYGDRSSIAEAVRLSLRAGDIREGVDIHLAPAPVHRIAGRVLGAMVPGIAIQLMRPATWGPGPRVQLVDAMVVDQEGRFTLRDVPAGEYRLTVLRTPWMPVADHGVPPLESLPTEPTLWADVPVTVSDRDEDVVVSLAEGARIRGRIEFDGAAMPPLNNYQSMLFVHAADGHRVDLRGRVEAGGLFETIGVPPGRYFLTAPAVEGWQLKSLTVAGRDATTTPIDIGHADVTDVVVTLARSETTLSGRVVRRAPLANTRGWLTVMPAESEGWTDFGFGYRYRTLELGTSSDFSVDVPPGDYLVVATDVRPDLVTERLRDLASRATRVTAAAGQAANVTVQLLAMPR